MAYLTQYQYYENAGNPPEDENWGSYQYVSLKDIVTNYLLMYAGNHSLVNNEERYKILFHAKRAVQELNYDAFKEVKVLQLNVCEDLRFILPSDYVNWIRLSYYANGIIRPMVENIQVNSAVAYQQNADCSFLYDVDGNVLTEQSDLDYDRIIGQKPSIYLNRLSPYDGLLGYEYGGNWYFAVDIGARYGLNTETANTNPTFRIDKKAGVINFDSTMANQSCILEYISDGMEGGDDSEITVNKLFEDYVYAYISYALLDSKLGVQEYVVNRARRKKSSLLRNAKIRLSNIHPGRLLQNLRGRDKWIK
jgi:hypothetical protein